MASRKRTRLSAESQPTVISAPTLKGAYKLVKKQFGDEAIILGSRTVNRRQALGLGHEKMVEVMVSAPSSLSRQDLHHSGNVWQETPSAGLDGDLTLEIERIENLVEAIASQYEELESAKNLVRDNPLAENLISGGADIPTVEKLLTRFTSETGQPADNRVAALSWLGENIKASNCDWDGFYGCHAFMSSAGTGQSDLVLAAAAHLQRLERRTLVLKVLPENSGEIRRLQVDASRLGFDAAVIKKPTQLARSAEHLARYDVVLVDMPSLENPAMAEEGTLYSWLSGNTSFHRHLLLSCTQDPRDLEKASQVARSWNCDWLGLTRLEQTTRPAKVLDFADRIPLPFSLVQHSGNLEIADSGRLLDFILGQKNISRTSGLDQMAKG